MLWSAHLSMLFHELPYLERPRAAARAGFTLVETWWPPEGLAERWADEVTGNALSVSLINAYAGDLEAGERGFLNVPEWRAEVMDGADCPGRGPPGSGTVDLRALVSALEGAGYAGAIGLEFDPHGPTLEALGRFEW